MLQTLTTVNVHFNDETVPVAEKVTNFVSLRIGDVDLFLMNVEQASRLADAAMDAYNLLMEMERPESTFSHQMLEAGKAWIRSIHGEDYDGDLFRPQLGWTLEDWDVVLRRSGSVFHTSLTQSRIDDFHLRYASQYQRGL